jgi:TP901 family phage tail tape measure protein
MIGGGINNLGVGIVLQAIGANTTASQLGQVGAAAQKMGQSFASINWSAIRYGFDQLARLGAPVFSTLRRGASAAFEFERGMASIQRTIQPDEFAKNASSIRALVKDLTTKYPGEGGFLAAIEAVRELIKTGLGPELANFKQAAESAFSVWRIEGGNPAKVMQQLSQITMQLRGKLSDLPEVAGKIARIALDIPGGVRDVLQGMTNMAGLGDMMKGGESEMSALLAVLNKVGFGAGRAGTVLSRMLQNLAQGAWKSQDPLRELGILTKRFLEPMEGNKFKSMPEFILELGAAIEKLPKKEWQAGFLGREFGATGIRGFMALYRMFKANYGEYLKILSNVETAGADFATRQAAAGGNNVYGAFTRLKDEISKVAVNVGESLLEIFNVRPGIQSLAESVGRVADAYHAMFVKGMSAAEAQERFKGSAATATMINNFVLSLSGAFSGLLEVVKDVVGILPTGIGTIMGKVVGFSTVIVGIGLSFGIVGLAAKAVKASFLAVIGIFGAGKSQADQMGMGLGRIVVILQSLERTLVHVALAAKMYTHQMFNAGAANSTFGNSLAVAQQRMQAELMARTAGAGGAGAGAGGGFFAGFLGGGLSASGAAFGAIPRILGAGYRGSITGLQTVGLVASAAGRGLLNLIPVVGTVVSFGWILADVFKELFGVTKERLAQEKKIRDRQLEEKLQKQHDLLTKSSAGYAMVSSSYFQKLLGESRWVWYGRDERKKETLAMDYMKVRDALMRYDGRPTSTSMDIASKLIMDSRAIALKNILEKNPAAAAAARSVPEYAVMNTYPNNKEVLHNWINAAFHKVMKEGQLKEFQKNIESPAVESLFLSRAYSMWDALGGRKMMEARAAAGEDVFTSATKTKIIQEMLNTLPKAAKDMVESSERAMDAMRRYFEHFYKMNLPDIKVKGELKAKGPEIHGALQRAYHQASARVQLPADAGPTMTVRWG